MTQNALAHTPGPWTWQQAGNHFEVNSDTRWSAVATVEPNRLDSREVDHSEAEANARLIAAAPDLLEAAKRAVAAFAALGSPECEAAKRCRAAINRATGD